MANCWKCGQESDDARCGSCAAWNRCGDLLVNGVLRDDDDVTIYVAEESGPGHLILDLKEASAKIDKLPGHKRKRSIKSKAFAQLWTFAIGDHPLLAEATPMSFRPLEADGETLLFVEVHGLPAQPSPPVEPRNGVDKSAAVPESDEQTDGAPDDASSSPGEAASDPSPAPTSLDLGILPATPPSASAHRIAMLRESVYAASSRGDLANAINALENELQRPSSARQMGENLYVHSTLAGILHQSGNVDAALAAYARAFAVDPRDLDVLRGYADVLGATESTDLQIEVDQILLLHHRDYLEPDQLGEVYCRLGRAHFALEDWERARSCFEHALHLRSDDAEAMNGLLDAVKAQDDPQLVIEVRQRVLDNMADPKGRAMVLVSIGDDYRKRLGDIERAIEHYEASVSEYPNAPAMTRLAKFALDAEDWKRAVIAFKSMAKSLKDPLERADAWAQAGSLYEHRLGAPAKAVHAYEKALNLNPNKLEPFESLVQLLAETKKWDELQASYERMIGRLEKTEAPGAVVMAALWTNLGEVKRHHLSDEEGATAAYEEACKATPHDRNLRSTLATLYASHAEDEECLRRAVEHNQALLLHNGEIDVVALQRIGMLYLDAQRYDPAWCVFRALAYLGAADARSEVFVEKYQSQVIREPEGAIDDAFFEQHLYTDGYDAPVGEIFAIAKHALLKLFAHDLDNYGIHKKKDRVDTRDGLMFNTLYQNIAQKLGFEEAPPVYEYQKVPSMVNGSLYPQGFLVGPGMLAGRSENEMSFTVAKQLAMFRDNAFLFGFRRLLDMQAIFVTLAKVTNPGINIQMTDDMRRLSRAFDKVKPPERKDRLHAIMVEVLQRTSSKVNLAEVARCLDNAANRCGFLFCDDLKACHEMLTLESHPDNNTAERPSLEVRMQDLVLWSVTPEYHALREQLGIAIDQSQ